MSTKPIVILGGGPTGLAAAYRLSQMGKPVVLIEKEKYLGGLSATLKYQNFYYEFGPHAFHLKDPQITNWLKNLLGKDFRLIPTNTQVLIKGKLYNYPLKASDLLRKIPPFLGLKIFKEYCLTFFANLLGKKKPRTFQEWGLTNFGPTLYQMSFGDFTAKVWGINPAQLSVKLASQKLSRLNLGDIIIKLFGFKGKVQPAYFKKYLYPQKGIEVIFHHLAKKISQNNQILLGSEVIKLKNIGGQIRLLEYQDSSGKIKKISPSKVISTITIKDLALMINHPVGGKVLQVSQKLQYRDMIIVYFITQEKNLPSSQWIYLVEDKFQFNRLTIAKNLSPLFAPQGKTVLAFEICCQKGDCLWQKKDSQLKAMAQKDMEKLNFNPLKINHSFVKRIENAYPIYKVNFENNLKKVFGSLSKIDNLFSTGRNGLYLNSDIHDCLKIGFDSADFVGLGDFTSQQWYRKAQKKWLN